MFSLKALFRRGVAVAPVAGLLFVFGCQGPDEFLRFSSNAGQPGPGAGGTSGAGTGGTTGGTTGSGGGPIGAAGMGGSGGSIGGTAGTGTGGSVQPAGTGGAAGGAGGRGGSSGGRGGAAGTNTSGGSGGVTGTAGATGTGGVTGSGGRGGTTTGTAGAAGSAGGRGGAGGTAMGGAGGSAAGTGGSATGGAGGGTVSRLQVVARCQPSDGAQDIRVTFKILNPDSVTKQLSDIKVRYYFTPSAQLPAMVKFDFLQKVPEAMVTTTVTDTYVEIGFMSGAGTVVAFDTITGSDEIQLHLYNYSTPTWNTSETDDYSFASCASGASTSAYTDRTTMPGYYQGQLAWGSEPSL